MGLFWGVEFVQNKETKEPFPVDSPIADLVVAEGIRLGAVVYPGMKGAADGSLGDHIMLCPPYIISEAEIVFLVDTLLRAIQTVIP